MPQILEEAGGSAVADLNLARDYLGQLEEAAAAFANEYNETVTELHRLTYADVSQLQAEEALNELQAVAKRALALGAPDDLMQAAQVRANALHASHVELLHARSSAEAALLDAARVTHTIGVAGVEPLRAALAHAESLYLQSEVVTSAQATLDHVIHGEERRLVELEAANEELGIAVRQGQYALQEVVEAGTVLRHFSSAVALRAAIKRAIAAGVDQHLVYEAQHQLSPIEAAERSHNNEVQFAAEALHRALAADDEDALLRAVPASMPIRGFIPQELFDTAERRMNEFGAARELARAKTALEKELEVADGPEVRIRGRGWSRRPTRALSLLECTSAYSLPTPCPLRAHSLPIAALTSALHPPFTLPRRVRRRCAKRWKGPKRLACRVCSRARQQPDCAS